MSDSKQQEAYSKQAPQHPASAQPPPQPVAVTIQPASYQGPVHRYFREAPVQVKCQHCQADVVTTLHYEAGKVAWIACLVLFMFGLIAVLPFLWFGCCLPFCIKAFKEVVHKCPNCQHEVGRYGRLY